MAITHPIQIGERVNFDPDDVRGPWTFTLPAVGAGHNGVSCSINATTYGAAVVKVDAQAPTLIGDPEFGSPQSSIAGSLTGDCLNFKYNEGADQWYLESTTAQESQFALMRGQPANFSPGASFTAIQNWPEGAGSPLFDTPVNLTTGVITIPRDGIYSLTAQIMFQQGNSNKELAALLWLRSSVVGDVLLDSLQISDDKTDYRALKCGFVSDFDEGETVQLGISWVNQSMGTLNMLPSSWNLSYFRGLVS